MISAHEAVDEVARTSYGRLVAYLAAHTGDLAAAEDAMADAFEAALRTWPTKGVPERPVSWMITAARRSLIGRRRRDDTALRAAPTIALLAQERAESADTAVPDKRLELLFACAHPAIDPTMHAPLMLQAVFRIDAERMGPAFLVEAAAIGQRLVRAKRKIADARIPFALPAPEDIEPRTGAVLEAIFAAYGTGWEDPAGADPGRSGLTREAIRLANVLTELRPHDAEVLGLAAHLHHLEARTDARRDSDGRFVPLAAQDPWRWAPHHLAAGERLLNRALSTQSPGPYALMASISSLHNRRVINNRIEWPAIAALYDRLLPLRTTVGVAVARAAAHLAAGADRTAAEGLAAIDRSLIENHQPFWTVLAEVADQRDDEVTRAAARERALQLTTDPAVRTYLAARWAEQPRTGSRP